MRLFIDRDDKTVPQNIIIYPMYRQPTAQTNS